MLYIMGERDFLLELLESTNLRLTDLSKSYHVLNDSHKELELKMARMESRIDTTTAIVKWLISPIAVIGLTLQILQIIGVI